MSTWLLVEDEPDIYEILNHLYDVLDSRSVVFTTGEDAANWIAAVAAGQITDSLPIFALIDIRLPGEINGIEVGERLRQCAPLKNIPLVLMTAYRLSPFQEQSALKRTGAHQILYKPLPRFAELRQLFVDLVK